MKCMGLYGFLVLSAIVWIVKASPSPSMRRGFQHVRFRMKEEQQKKKWKQNQHMIAAYTNAYRGLCG